MGPWVPLMESFTAQKLDTEVVPMIFLISIVTFSNGWQGYFPYSARFPAFRRELDPECLLGGCQHVAITRNFLPPQFITEKKGNHRHQKNIPSRRYWFIKKWNKYTMTNRYHTSKRVKKCNTRTKTNIPGWLEKDYPLSECKKIASKTKETRDWKEKRAWLRWLR